jgi:hypothetical protein
MYLHEHIHQALIELTETRSPSQWISDLHEKMEIIVRRINSNWILDKMVQFVIHIEPIRFAEKSWLKVLFADLL